MKAARPERKNWLSGRRRTGDWGRCGGGAVTWRRRSGGWQWTAEVLMHRRRKKWRNTLKIKLRKTIPARFRRSWDTGDWGSWRSQLWVTCSNWPGTQSVLKKKRTAPWLWLTSATRLRRGVCILIYWPTTATRCGHITEYSATEKRWQI